MASASEPKTLLEAVNYFSDKTVAFEFMKAIRWTKGEPVCPRCGCCETSFLTTRQIWKCKGCAKQFSVKVGTIFEDSPIGLDKWLPAMWLLANCKNGISSYELGRALGVTQKTAWFMLSRLRLALQDTPKDKFTGHIEADETYIGGRARYMHSDKKRRLGKQAGRSLAGKVAVMGLLARHERKGKSQVRTKVLTGVRKSNIQDNVKRNVGYGSQLSSDAFFSYNGLDKFYVHKVVDHAETYVKGNVHTNGMENFWSLLKRAIKGTYVSVEPFHLFRYLDEQSFRFNQREGNDASRFAAAVKGLIGKRLTYTALTGSELPQTC
jgi:transposase-like protein